jgi:hypothetical protein
MMDDAGSVDYGREYALALAERASEDFDLSFGSLPDSPHRRFLAESLEFVVNRRL